MRALALLPVLLAPTLAFAAGKPSPADKHDPAVFVDFGGTWINVVGYDADYSVHGTFRVYGATSAKDRLRMEWMSGGKLIGSAPCTGSVHTPSKTLTADCSLEKHATAVGPIDVDLVYIDDQTDQEFLVTTFHVTVRKWPGPGKSFNWGILPDDLLGASFVRHWYGADGDAAFHMPLFEFWSTSNRLVGDATMRCTVDGAKLPDFDAHVDNVHASGQREIEVRVNTPKDNRVYLYEHYDVEPGFHFGSKAEHGLYDPEKLKWIIDHPGKWDCMLRKDGHQVREFIFTVNDKGMVEQSDMQQGKHPVPTLNNVVLIDMKIPADNGVEQRVRPDAMKKSIGFGVAWPDGAKVKEIQSAFPPASGLPD